MHHLLLYLSCVSLLGSIGCEQRRLLPKSAAIPSVKQKNVATRAETPAAVSSEVPKPLDTLNIRGDFDGDGRMEVLRAQTLQRPGYNPFNAYDSPVRDDYDKWVAWTVTRHPLVVLTSSDKELDTLKIGEGQIFGLCWLKNEGDLNGDGTDEVSYVPDYADWSNFNSCHLMTWRSSGWQTLLAFDIHEDQIPGTEKWYLRQLSEVPTDTILDAGKARQNFPGFITPIQKGTIQIRYFDSEAETEDGVVSKVIRLRR